MPAYRTTVEAVLYMIVPLTLHGLFYYSLYISMCNSNALSHNSIPFQSHITLHTLHCSSKCYIYGASFKWIIKIFAWTLTLLASHDVLDFSYGTVTNSCVMVLCLITICVWYLTIRTRVSFRDPVMDTTQTKATESQKDAKPSRTLFIMIATSLFALVICISNVVTCFYLRL